MGFEQELKEHINRLFKDDVESADHISNHPIGVAAYSELIEAGYEKKHIPLLLKKILSIYDRIKENKKINQIILNSKNVKKFPPEDRMLATALALTCRGEYQCPTSMRLIFKRAGGLKFVNKAGEIIDEPLQYDPEKRFKSLLSKFKQTFQLDNDFIEKCLKTWRESKHSVTTEYVAGLVYYTSLVKDLSLTQKDVAEVVSVSDVAVRDNSKKIARTERQFYQNELDNISVEFQNRFDVDVEFEREIRRRIGKYRLGVKLVEYLLENKHDEKNPTHEWSLPSEFEYRLSYILKYSSLNPLLLGIITMKNNKIYLKNRQKAENYVDLMKRAIKVGRVLNYY